MAALFYTRKQAESLAVQAAKAAVKQKGIVDQLEVESLDRAKADVSKWRNALEYWEDVRTPDRYDMYQLYAEIIQDDSVATHLNTICSRMEGEEMELGRVTDKGFDLDAEATKAIRSDWFGRIIRLVLESEMMGFSLVEIMRPEKGKYTADHVQLVPRELVIPEWQKVRKKPQAFYDLIDYTNPLYRPRLLEIGDRKEKGLFNNMALLYIYKKNAMAYWANYQSKFGIPPVIVKTDLSSKSTVDSLVNFLSQMRSNSFGLVGYDDKVDVLQGVNADVHQTFMRFIEHCDRQIAKVMEGQTMTSNDGSSRSQAEVHQETSEHWHMARIRKLENVINEQLIPIMVADSIIPDGLTFRYREIKDVDKIVDRIVKLKQAGFTVDAAYLSEITGFPLEEVQTVTAPQAQSVMDAVNKLYDDNQCNC